MTEVAKLNPFFPCIVKDLNELSTRRFVLENPRHFGCVFHFDVDSIADNGEITNYDDDNYHRVVMMIVTMMMMIIIIIIIIVVIIMMLAITLICHNFFSPLLCR